MRGAGELQGEKSFQAIYSQFKLNEHSFQTRNFLHPFAAGRGKPKICTSSFHVNGKIHLRIGA